MIKMKMQMQIKTKKLLDSYTTNPNKTPLQTNTNKQIIIQSLFSVMNTR